MQNLEILIANLHDLGKTITGDPLASALAGGLLGIAVAILLAVVLLRMNQNKMVRFREDMEQKYRSLQGILSQKTKEIATMEQTCERQKHALVNANARIAQLEESARRTPILERKIEQQLRQIESLTKSMTREIDSASTAAHPGSGVSLENAGSLSKEALIDQLGTRLYEQLTSLHQHIAEQSQLIVELQTELERKRESVAAQLFTKGQQIPKVAKSRFDERVIEPIQMRIDGFKQSVLAIPLQTRDKIDRLVIDPVYHRIHEIRTGLQQIPAQASAQLYRVALDPLNAFIEEINRTLQGATLISEQKFNELVTERLHNLLAHLKMSGRSLARETRENLNRLIVRPLENLLLEIRQTITAVPEQSRDQLNRYLLRPALQKLHALSESGKEASRKGIKNAGHWIVDSLAGSAPAAAT